MTRARVRHRQQLRVVNRRADWQLRVVVPGPAPRVCVSLPLPLLRRLHRDPALVTRIEEAAREYAATHRLGGTITA